MKLFTYKGELIAAGTTAAKLLEDRKLKELDAHMRDVNATYHRMRGTQLTQPLQGADHGRPASDLS